MTLTAVGSRDLAKPRAALPDTVAVVPVTELAHHADVIVECAPAAALPSIATPALAAGKTVVC